MVAMLVSDSGDIFFADPVSDVRVLYAGITITLEAFDTDGNLLSSASGDFNIALDTPRFRNWDPVSVSSTTSNIARVRVTGVPFST
ncbi:MAG: hypothetical protein V3T86_03615, partial [Planctomycetota bacterium]